MDSVNMNILVTALQAAVVVFSVVSANRETHCAQIECGSCGWFPKPQLSWTLEPGPYSTEVVPTSECLVGGIKGFKAKVCLDVGYPSLRCEGNDRVFVDKSNKYGSGRIDAIPCCRLLL